MSKRPAMTEDEFNNEKKEAYKRMLIGAVVGALVGFVLPLLWVIYKQNFTPQAGLGLLVFSMIGLVCGSLLGLISKRWQQD